MRAAALCAVALVGLATAFPAAAGEPGSIRAAVAERLPGAWWKHIHRLRAMPLNGQLLDEVDAIVDRARYVAEPPGRSVNEWRGPLTLYTAGGDCEDFALAKILILRQLGFDDADLAIGVYVNREGSAHAVAEVRLDGQRYVLDNDDDGRATPWSWTRYAKWRAIQFRDVIEVGLGVATDGEGL